MPLQPNALHGRGGRFDLAQGQKAEGTVLRKEQGRHATHVCIGRGAHEGDCV